MSVCKLFVNFLLEMSWNRLPKRDQNPTIYQITRICYSNYIAAHSWALIDFYQEEKKSKMQLILG